jgi:hypothetical protein
MKTVVISFKKISNMSEKLEGAFFNWLRENNIPYTASDFISHNIFVEEHNVSKIKKVWPEIIKL